MFGNQREIARLEALYKQLEAKNIELIKSKDDQLFRLDEALRLERERVAELMKVAQDHRASAALHDFRVGLSGWIPGTTGILIQIGFFKWLVEGANNCQWCTSPILVSDCGLVASPACFCLFELYKEGKS